MVANQPLRSTGFAGAVHRGAEGWALLGGLILLAVVGANILSVIGKPLGISFAGDFELTEMGVAVAAFAFLPYCQITRANVTADIFTSGVSPRMMAFLNFAGAFVALAFSIILLWRMLLGMQEQKTYGYATTILQIPQWLAFVPILLSLGLLMLTSLVSAMEEWKKAKQGAKHV